MRHATDQATDDARWVRLLDRRARIARIRRDRIAAEQAHAAAEARLRHANRADIGGVLAPIAVFIVAGLGFVLGGVVGGAIAGPIGFGIGAGLGLALASSLLR